MQNFVAWGTLLMMAAVVTTVLVLVVIDGGVDTLAPPSVSLSELPEAPKEHEALAVANDPPTFLYDATLLFADYDYERFQRVQELIAQHGKRLETSVYVRDGYASIELRGRDMDPDALRVALAPVAKTVTIRDVPVFDISTGDMILDAELVIPTDYTWTVADEPVVTRYLDVRLTDEGTLEVDRVEVPQMWIFSCPAVVGHTHEDCGPPKRVYRDVYEAVLIETIKGRHVAAEPERFEFGEGE